MIRLLNILLFLTFSFSSVYATHNRAGEITYKHLGGYSYEFTVITYTYALSSVRRTELGVTWGDGTSSVIPLLNPPGHVLIENTTYLKNTYVAQHTFPGAGVYQVLMEDPNRNQGVNNIPNSVNVIFSIKTTMLIGSEVGSNNTPVLLNPPIDRAARGHRFIHNPGAYDSDGDSVSYAITTCTGASGQDIEGYVLPAATDTLFINEYGDLTWITPAELGIYNIAILVEEWRNGLRIGRISRDMQIEVFQTDNNPPVNSPVYDTCILAGDTLELSFFATDADNDLMRQEMIGGPFEVAENPAVFLIDSNTVDYGFIESSFQWITNCTHARHQPYTALLRTQDINDDINLVDISSFNIKVLHKPPYALNAIPGTDTIRVEWEESTCGTPSGYNIYRRLGSYNYIPDYCETGVPTYTDYVLIGSVEGNDVTHFTDDNNGQGLVPGYDYCYRVTAVYSDGAESISSEEVCTNLIPGSPPILQVSVLADDETDGIIEVLWAVPEGEGIDTLTGPFRYEVQRMDPGGDELVQVALLPSADLLDTTYTDEGLNTLIFPYTYSIILHYQYNGDWNTIADRETATSQYIYIDGKDNMLTLNMRKRAPWLNTSYDVYRKNTSDDFDLIGSTTESVYHDEGLKNEVEYTYRTIGHGVRPLFDKEYRVENISHIASGMPIDTIPPCPPDLHVEPQCNNLTALNRLTWEPPADTCTDQDIIAYIVYSRDSLYGNFEVLDTLGSDVFTYDDVPDYSIEQCYTVTAVDSSYNESDKIDRCTFNLCGLYELPNAFTPDGNGNNDIFTSFNLNGYVKRVNMSIFNRYGKLLFTTSDPDINWDGRFSGKLVPTGVYYYICEVFEPRITGIRSITLTGFIHVYPGDDNITLE